MSVIRNNTNINENLEIRNKLNKNQKWNIKFINNETLYLQRNNVW